MKKILNALFLTLLAVFTFSSCSDVPAPYDILGEGDVPGLTGDGSKDNPYTVSDLKAKADGTTVAWVQAYIVAGIKSSTDMSISSENDVVFGTQPTGVKATAFLIADDRGESDYKNCSAVNLSGKTAGCSEVKAALNLVDNATTPLPRLVTLKGTLVKNTWGLPGLKEVTTAILEDGTIVGEGGDEPTPPVGGVTFFEESFASDKGAFTIEDKTRPTKVSEIWKWESYTPEGGTASTYMKASAYISATEKEASESWLISPVVNLTKATKASLTFEHAHKFCGDPAKELTIWVKESTASDWTQATIPTYGTNQDWKFVSSGNIDLAGYVGKNIQFAFKYISTTSNVGTWEVKNVKIVGEGEGGGETPTPETVAVTKGQPYEETFSENVGRFTIAAPIGELEYVWKVDTEHKYLKGSCYNKGAMVAEGWVISPLIDLSLSSKTKLTFVQNSFSAGLSNEFMLKVKLDGTDTWSDLTFDRTAGGWTELVTTVDLSAYDTKKIQLAFVCKNENTSKANTWEIWNFKVAVGEDGGGVEPDPTSPFSSNIALPTEDNSEDSYYGGKIQIGEGAYDILKLGTSSKIGTWTSPTFGKSATKLSFYALGWKGQTATLIVTIDGATFAGGTTTQTISLSGNDGIFGNPPFVINAPSSSDFFEYTLNDVTANTKIKFATDEQETAKNRRAVIFGVNIE